MVTEPSSLISPKRRRFTACWVPVTAFKWAFGHLLAASGILEMLLALVSLRRGTVPGVATLQTLDPRCAPLTVSPQPQTPRSDVALVLCRGFAGTNVALLITGRFYGGRSVSSESVNRCGVDSVEIARVEQLLQETPRADLSQIFSGEELRECGDGTDRAARLAARFAAKEACLKLFPRETAMGDIGPQDFVITRDGYGTPRLHPGPEGARAA